MFFDDTPTAGGSPTDVTPEEEKDKDEEKLDSDDDEGQM